jgi:hypothetical protein
MVNVSAAEIRLRTGLKIVAYQFTTNAPRAAIPGLIGQVFQAKKITMLIGEFSHLFSNPCFQLFQVHGGVFGEIGP